MRASRSRWRCEGVGHGPWFAVILGKRGKIKGLMLHDDWESYRLMAQRAYEEIADQLRMTAVHFEPLSKASPEARKMVKDHGLELASSRAYPSVFRMERGRLVRLPDATELDLLEACLWVIPDFLKRAKDRTPEVLVYNFKGLSGMMTLDLSWVPMERLQARTDPSMSDETLSRRQRRVSNTLQADHPGEIRHASVPKPSDRQQGQETRRDRRGTSPGEALPGHPLDDHQEPLWRARSRSSLRPVPGSENPEARCGKSRARNAIGNSWIEPSRS